MTPSGAPLSVVFATYPFAFFVPGGGEIQLRKYFEYLPATGIQVSLFDSWNPRLEAGDCLHYFSCMSGSLPFLNFAKERGARVFVSPNLWVEDDETPSYPVEEIRRIFLLADGVVCNSLAEKTLLSRVFDVFPEKFFVVPNAVDDIFMESVPAKQFRESFKVSGRFVLNVANIESRKNQLALIEAMRAFPDHDLIAIGGVRDQAYLDACRVAGAGRFIHIDRMDHHSELLRSAYAACDVFCLPSTVETPGLAALEAAASGARVVVTAKGSAFEYFRDDAWYVDHRSISSITEGLRAALADPKPGNPVMRERIRSRYRWAHAAHALAEAYGSPTPLAPGVRGLGFYGTEIDDAGDVFHWGRKDAVLLFGGERLRFEVLALMSCEITFLGEGEQTLLKVELVANQWIPIDLRISASNARKIRFTTAPDATTSPPGDSRRLCLAVKRLRTA